MVIGIKEDFTSSASLDSELRSIPTSGLYVNNGVHPSITLENLLAFLPNIEFTFEQWENDVAYEVYATSKNRKDIVLQGTKIYQSIKAGTNKDPEAEDSEYWLETNIESLRIKSFIDSVKDRMLGDLNLNKRLVNNQYIYEVGKTERTLPNDYAAWVFEPKGSDYMTIRINEISLQKSGTTPVDVYVINQGKLIDTLSVTPTNGTLGFSDLGYVFTGKGAFYLAIDSTEVLTDNLQVDPLKYDGFVAYTATGTGEAPESAVYSYSTNGNGLGFNISAYLDASKYIENNLSEFGNFFKATVEYMVFEYFLSNPNNRSNRNTAIQMDDAVLMAELKNVQANTVARRYEKEKGKALGLIEKTFDTHLSEGSGIEISVGSL